jgi:hypothetical protein
VVVNSTRLSAASSKCGRRSAWFTWPREHSALIPTCRCSAPYAWSSRHSIGLEVLSRQSDSSGNRASCSRVDCLPGQTRANSCGRHRSIRASCRFCTIRATPAHLRMAARAHASGPMVAPVSSRLPERTGSSSCLARIRATSTGTASRPISVGSRITPAPSVASVCRGQPARAPRYSKVASCAVYVANA